MSTVVATDQDASASQAILDTNLTSPPLSANVSMDSLSSTALSEFIPSAQPTTPLYSLSATNVVSQATPNYSAASPSPSPSPSISLLPSPSPSSQALNASVENDSSKDGSSAHPASLSSWPSTSTAQSRAPAEETHPDDQENESASLAPILCGMERLYVSMNKDNAGQWRIRRTSEETSDGGQ
jgi:hypothetical protein